MSLVNTHRDSIIGWRIGLSLFMRTQAVVSVEHLPYDLQPHTERVPHTALSCRFNGGFLSLSGHKSTNFYRVYLHDGKSFGFWTSVKSGSQFLQC